MICIEREDYKVIVSYIRINNSGVNESSYDKYFEIVRNGVILHEYFISRNKNLKCEYKEVN